MPQDRPSYKYIKEALRDKTNLNKESQQKASWRIEMAVEQIEREREEGLPNKVGECKLLVRNVTKELFGISVSDATLKKPENLPLWHPKYRVKQKPAAPQEQTEEEPVVEEVEVVKVEEVEVVEEQDTTAVISIEEKPEAANPTNKTIEPKVSLQISNVSKVLQGKNKPPVGQEILQLKQPPHKQDRKQSRPSDVICKKEASPKTPKSIPSLDLQKTVHTLTYMKGMMPYLVCEFFFQVFQRAYYNALMRIPRLELIYQSNQENCDGGLVKRKGQKQSLFELISPNTEVEILRKDYHSSSFRENPSQLLVYVKPIDNAFDWLDGIAVSISCFY